MSSNVKITDRNGKPTMGRGDGVDMTPADLRLYLDVTYSSQAHLTPLTIAAKDESIQRAAAEYAITSGEEVVLATPDAERIIREQIASMRGVPVERVQPAEVEPLLARGDEPAVQLAPAGVEIEPEHEQGLEIEGEAPAIEPEQAKPAPSVEAESEVAKAKALDPEQPAPAKAAALDNEQRFPRKSPAEVLLENAAGRALVRDHGDSIAVTHRAMRSFTIGQRKSRDAALATSLESAVKRFGEPVRVDGKEQFIAHIARIAAEKGIELEPANERVAAIIEKKQQELSAIRLERSQQRERAHEGVERSREARGVRVQQKGPEIG